jgi:hypothetical protein
MSHNFPLLYKQTRASAKILKVLADENINIITLTIAETSDFGIHG